MDAIFDSAKCGSKDDPRLHLAAASSAWGLLFQSGVEIQATVGLPVAEFLRRELELSEKRLAELDSVVLNGQPVDDPASAVVGDGARLALAAGLPGIAGLALRSDSPLKALRARLGENRTETAAPQPGRVTLCLYSLAQGRLAGHFLRRGLWVTPDQLRRYGRFALNDSVCLDGRTLPVAELLSELEGASTPAKIFLTGEMAEEPPSPVRDRS